MGSVGDGIGQCVVVEGGDSVGQGGEGDVDVGDDAGQNRVAAARKMVDG